MSEPIPPSPLPQELPQGMPAGEPTSALCGIAFPPGLPPLPFGSIPSLPSFSFPPAIPALPLPPIGLNCATDNPLAFAQDVPAGGGRESNVLPDPDNDYDTATTT